MSVTLVPDFVIWQSTILSILAEGKFKGQGGNKTAYISD